MNEFTEQSQDSWERMEGNVIWITEITDDFEGKTTTDQRIFRTFVKLVENKTKSYCLEFKIEGKRTE